LIFAVLLVLQLCITAILSNKPALDVFSSAEWVDLALWFWLWIIFWWATEDEIGYKIGQGSSLNPKQS
jgi:hypothetical protein